MHMQQAGNILSVTHLLIQRLRGVALLIPDEVFVFRRSQRPYASVLCHRLFRRQLDWIRLQRLDRLHTAGASQKQSTSVLPESLRF